MERHIWSGTDISMTVISLSPGIQARRTKQWETINSLPISVCSLPSMESPPCGGSAGAWTFCAGCSGDHGHWRELYARAYDRRSESSWCDHKHRWNCPECDSSGGTGTLCDPRTKGNSGQKAYERMCDIAKGAALITGTTVDIRQVAAYSNVIGNDVLEEVMDKNLDHFIPIGYTEEELAYAGKFKEVVTELDKEGLKDMIAHVVEKDKRKEVLDMPLLDFKLDRSESYGGGGSTDIGDVSWVVPTVQTNVCCYAAGTALHSWQAVAQGKASIAHKGMLTAAKVMACTGADLLENPELIKKAHKDWLEELDGETYPNPLPKDETGNSGKNIVIF